VNDMLGMVTLEYKSVLCCCEVVMKLEEGRFDKKWNELRRSLMGVSETN